MTYICGVCGDKAIGYNFGSISCESCKAFFRRNVMENKLKCYYGENCKIDKTNRTSCKRCRLMKCLDIGMKTELLLTEKEKQLRRALIEENRNKREKTINKSTEVMDLLPKTENNELNALLEVIESKRFDDFDISEEMSGIESCICVDNIRTFGSETVAQTGVESELCLIPIHTNQEILEIDNYLSDHSIADSSDTGYQSAIEVKSELALIPIDRPITDYRNNFNELEGNKLAELFNATNYLQNPKTRIGFTVNNDFFESIRVLQTKGVYELKKLVKMAKNLTGFKCLLEQDQIILLKWSCLEIAVLRMLMNFNFEMQYWNVITDTADSTAVQLKLYIEEQKGIFQQHKNFLGNMGPEWDSDIVIIDLLSAILLFNSNRPKLIHKEVIKLQQKSYIHLLQRYLLLRYRSDSESKSKFWRLFNCLQFLHILDDEISSFYMTYKFYESPLLTEVFDRNN